jgi:hypothetical protein
MALLKRYLAGESPEGNGEASHSTKETSPKQNQSAITVP